MFDHSLKGILFDMDGVLVDSQRAWYQVIVRARTHFGYAPLSYQRFCSTFGQSVEDDCAVFFPSQSSAEVDAFYSRTFVEQVDAVRVIDGARQLLAFAATAGFRCGLVTNAPTKVALDVLEKKGLSSFFETVAAAGQAPAKPAPDLIYLALARLGLDACEALFVGDSGADVAAARAAGVTMVGFGVPAVINISKLGDLESLLARAR